MKPIFAMAAIAFGAALMYGASTAADAEKPDGKELFTKNKCQSCHSVDVASIKRVRPQTGARKAPDLSKIGDKRDAEWIDKFVDKKEKIDDKTHLGAAFKGTPAERAAVAAWLASLKSEESDAAKGASEEAKEAKEAATEAKEEAQEAKKAAEQAKDAAQEAKEEVKEHEKEGGSGHSH